MAIHMDKLPTQKPEGQGNYALPEPGLHKATVKAFQMKSSKANPGTEYLEIQLKLESGPVVFDKLFESDAPALQYKLGRYISACKLPLVGELTLADLGRVTVGKELGVDIVIKDNEWNGKVTQKAEVEIFAGDIYYTLEEYAAIKGTAGGAAPATTTPSGSY